jgi:hypothetical protein
MQNNNIIPDNILSDYTQSKNYYNSYEIHPTYDKINDDNTITLCLALLSDL